MGDTTYGLLSGIRDSLVNMIRTGDVTCQFPTGTDRFPMLLFPFYFPYSPGQSRITIPEFKLEFCAMGI
jgi:hypothetical protein